MNINAAGQNDHDYTSDINEAINFSLGEQLLLSPLDHTDGLSEMSSEPSDRSRDASSRPRRRSPPPPPLHLSPLNMRSFLSEPEVSVAGKQFLFSPLHHTDSVSETSSESSDSDGSRDSSSTRRRRSPPPPPSPPPRRMAQSGTSRPLSETSSSVTPRRSHSVRRPAPPPPQSPRQSRTSFSQINVSSPSPGPIPTSSDSGGDTRRTHSVRRPAPPPPQSPRQSRMPRSPINVSSPPLGPLPTSSDSGGDTPRRAHSVRRPAPPPPQSPRQSRTPRLPTNVSSTSHRPLSLPPDPTRMASMSKFAQDMNAFAASITRDLSRQTRGVRCSDSVIISNSNVDGMTVNNGGTNNSGAGVSFFALFLGSFRPLNLIWICSHPQDGDASTFASTRPTSLGLTICLVRAVLTAC